MLAVVDSAEIPTLQQRREVDTDADGTVTDAERRRQAGRTCAALAAATEARLAGRPLRMAVTSADFAYRPGAAGLPVSRLECRLRADADLSRPAALEFSDRYQADRVGWHEITAAGTGVRLERSSVPGRSVSQELRSYPRDLLTSPLDVRSAQLRTTPGAGNAPSGRAFGLPAAGPLDRLAAGADGAVRRPGRRPRR